MASGNYTVGQVADMVKSELEQLTNKQIGVELKDIQDFRNYKVSMEKAKTVLGYTPEHSIADTVKDIFEHAKEYGDFSDESFYNIIIFKNIDRDKK